MEYFRFTEIRNWARKRGLYKKGDPKSQTLKLQEEVGELAKAILEKNQNEIKDGIGDCVVVLTNLAYVTGFSIEECIKHAYEEIENREGIMYNGTFIKKIK